MNYRITVLIGAFLFFPTTGAMAQDTDDMMDFIDGRYETTADMARTLWEYAEVGYKETKSSALIQAALRADGFAIEAGIAGIPTAFVATYGSGGPVIGIMAEFDALPGINQDALSSRVPIAGKNAAATSCAANALQFVSSMTANSRPIGFIATDHSPLSLCLPGLRCQCRGENRFPCHTVSTTSAGRQ